MIDALHARDKNFTKYIINFMVTNQNIFFLFDGSDLRSIVMQGVTGYDLCREHYFDILFQVICMAWGHF